MYNTILLISIIALKLANCYTFNTNIKNNEIFNQEGNSFCTIQKPGVTSFFLTSEKNKPALINFKIKNSSLLFSLGLINNKLTLNNNKNKFIEIDTDKSVNLSASILSLNSIKSNGAIKFNNVDQWKLILHDNFSKNFTSLNWNHDKITTCRKYNIMGGNCQTSNKELVKEIVNIPEHNQIRIEASYHFIGLWDSQTGYLKLDNLNNRKNEPKYVWTYRCKISKNKSSVSVCPYNTCKMGSPVDITVGHSESTIKLIFGSSLDGNSCDRSYGISDVKVYIK